MSSSKKQENQAVTANGRLNLPYKEPLGNVILAYMTAIQLGQAVRVDFYCGNYKVEASGTSKICSYSDSDRAGDRLTAMVNSGLNYAAIALDSGASYDSHKATKAIKDFLLNLDFEVTCNVI